MRADMPMRAREASYGVAALPSFAAEDAPTADLSGSELDDLLAEETRAVVLPKVVVILADEVARLESELEKAKRIADTHAANVRAWRETSESLEESLQRTTAKLQAERAMREEAQRSEGEALARAAMALAGIHGFGGAADGGSEASQAAQDSLSSLPAGAGAESGEQPAPASAPGQQDGAGPGRAEGLAAELLRAAGDQFDCPILTAVHLDSATRALTGEGVQLSVATGHGSVDVNGHHVAIRLAPGGAE